MKIISYQKWFSEYEKKLIGKEAYAIALDSQGNWELEDFYAALLTFFYPIHYRVSTLTLTKIPQIIFLNSLRRSSIRASNLASNSEASECKWAPVSRWDRDHRVTKKEYFVGGWIWPWIE